jgi:hypothetical protein
MASTTSSRAHHNSGRAAGRSAFQRPVLLFVALATMDKEKRFVELERSWQVWKIDSIHCRIGARCKPFAGLALAAGPDRGVEFGGGVFEVAAGVVLVAEHVKVPGSRAPFEQRDADIALADLQGGIRQRAWSAVQCEQAAQAQAPELTAVARAVAGVGRVSELAAAGRLDTSRARHRRRVDQDEIVAITRRLAREHPGHLLDRVAQPLTALYVPAPLRRQREQLREPLARGVQEPSVGGDPHDRLRDRQGDDPRVGQGPPDVLRWTRQEAVGATEHCNQQQVEVGVHRGPLGSTARVGAADFDLTAAGPCLEDTASTVELVR